MPEMRVGVPGKDGEVLFEADVSATQSAPTENARVSTSDENGERPARTEAAASEGAKSAHSLARTPGDARLRRRGDFQRAYQDGKSFHGTFLVLVLFSSGKTATRTAVVASGKVGNAVARNRSKRLLREAYRQLRDRVRLGGLDLILVARRGCKEAQMGQVVQELSDLYKTAGLWKSPKE